MADHIYDTEFAMKEFETSGELQLMQKLKRFELKTIFDVGANIGEWTKMVRDRTIDQDIHCFEPMPLVFRRLVFNTSELNVLPNSFGLSSQCEIRDMLFDHDNDRLTTPCLELARVQPEVIPLYMVDGSSYCRSRGIDFIDFLKIDTEGHEFQVLRGFGEELKEKRIKIIQFEYGYANILTKDLLIDFYRLLGSDYTIGKLSPDGVDFKTYGLLDEDFKGPNYVAVHNSFPGIISEIQTQ